MPIRRFRAGFCRGQNSAYDRAEIGLKGGVDPGITFWQIFAVAMQKSNIKSHCITSERRQFMKAFKV